MAATALSMVNSLVPGSRKALQFGVYGAVGGGLGSIMGEVVPFDGSPGPFLGTIAKVGVWFGIIGACIAVILLIGHAFYLKRDFSMSRSLREGGLFGFLAGATAGGIAQGAYGAIGPTEVLRVICWGIAGGLLGYTLSFRIPNLGRWPGLGGGTAGGVIGGCVFILFSFLLGQGAGRFGGITAIGFFIGLMIILAETMFREAWLEISYGPKEIRTVSLGLEPVSIGSDHACTVYARDVPAVAFRYKLEQGRIVCEDVASGNTASVAPGDRKAIGNITVSVHAAGTTVPVVSQTPSSPGRMSSFSLRLSSGRTFPLTEGMRLSATDIPGLEAQAVAGAVAEVNANPSDPTILGLKNLSRRSWWVTTAGGDRRQVALGQSIKLATGTKISFGSAEGEIQP